MIARLALLYTKQKASLLIMTFLQPSTGKQISTFFYKEQFTPEDLSQRRGYAIVNAKAAGCESQVKYSIAKVKVSKCSVWWHKGRGKVLTSLISYGPAKSYGILVYGITFSRK